eukprot:COSAG05_NODE_4908_length_1331_cov_0.832792_2_plen_104_part_01
MQATEITLPDFSGMQMMDEGLAGSGGSGGNGGGFSFAPPGPEPVVAGQRPLVPPMAQGGALAAGTEPEEELRIDVTDGNPYTRDDCIYAYGGTQECDAAPPALT